MRGWRRERGVVRWCGREAKYVIKILVLRYRALFTLRNGKVRFATVYTVLE